MPRALVPLPMPERRWNMHHLHHLHQSVSVRVRVWMDGHCFDVHGHASWEGYLKLGMVLILHCINC
jgi:hypothetical protein